MRAACLFARALHARIRVRFSRRAFVSGWRRSIASAAEVQGEPPPAITLDSSFPSTFDREVYRNQVGPGRETVVYTGLDRRDATSGEIVREGAAAVDPGK